MSCGRDQWQQNAHGLDCFNHVNYVTTRSNSQESLRARARSSTHVDFKRLPRNEIWTKTLLLQRQFLWKECYSKKTRRVKRDFLRRSKKSVFFFFEKRISKKKIEKWLTNFFSFQMSNERNSENIFLEGFKQVFLCQKKGLVYLVWKNKIEKQRKKKSETKKGIEQKKFYKNGWTNEKKIFSKLWKIKEIQQKVSHQEKTEET